MAIPAEHLAELQYLVFSSHKSATQTLVHTLRGAGLQAAHCHSLAHLNLGLAPGELSHLAERQHRTVGKLRIVSVFREPIQRLASSLFQLHGEGLVRQGKVPSLEDTIIYRYSNAQLTEFFIQEYCSERLHDESIPELCAELGIPVAGLAFDARKMHGTFEHDHCTIHLFRFDLFAVHAARLLSDMTGREVTITESNRSEGKWYEAKYAEFRKSLRMPPETVEQVYAARKQLVEIFHEDGYGSQLKLALDRYARPH